MSDFVPFLIFWRSGCQTLSWFQSRKRCEYYSDTFDCPHWRSGKSCCAKLCTCEIQITLLYNIELRNYSLKWLPLSTKTYNVIFHYFNQDEAVQRNIPRLSSQRYVFLLQVTIITPSGMSVLFLDLYFDFFFSVLTKLLLKLEQKEWWFSNTQLNLGSHFTEIKFDKKILFLETTASNYSPILVFKRLNNWP